MTDLELIDILDQWQSVCKTVGHLAASTWHQHSVLEQDNNKITLLEVQYRGAFRLEPELKSPHNDEVM